MNVTNDNLGQLRRIARQWCARTGPLRMFADDGRIKDKRGLLDEINELRRELPKSSKNWKELTALNTYIISCPHSRDPQPGWRDRWNETPIG